MSTSGKWERMREDLMALTMRQVRGIARREGIVLGYDGARKDTAVQAIVSWRRHAEETTGEERLAQYPEVCLRCPENGDDACRADFDRCYMDVIREGGE